jgi:hypothetical protein
MLYRMDGGSAAAAVVGSPAPIDINGQPLIAATGPSPAPAPAQAVTASPSSGTQPTTTPSTIAPAPDEPLVIEFGAPGVTKEWDTQRRTLMHGIQVQYLSDYSRVDLGVLLPGLEHLVVTQPDQHEDARAHVGEHAFRDAWFQRANAITDPMMNQLARLYGLASKQELLARRPDVVDLLTSRGLPAVSNEHAPPVGFAPEGQVMSWEGDVMQVDQALAESLSMVISGVMNVDAKQDVSLVDNDATRNLVNRYGEDRVKLMVMSEQLALNAQDDYFNALAQARRNPSGVGWSMQPVTRQVEVAKEGNEGSQYLETETQVVIENVFSVEAFSHWYVSQNGVSNKWFKQQYGIGREVADPPYFGAEGTQAPMRIEFVLGEGSNQQVLIWDDVPGARILAANLVSVNLQDPAQFHDLNYVSWSPAMGWVTDERNIDEGTDWLQIAATVIVVAVVAYFTGYYSAELIATTAIGGTVLGAAAVGLAIGATTSAASGLINGNFSWDTVVKGAVRGAVGGALTFGLTEMATSFANSVMPPEAINAARYLGDAETLTRLQSQWDAAFQGARLIGNAIQSGIMSVYGEGKFFEGMTNALTGLAIDNVTNGLMAVFTDPNGPYRFNPTVGRAVSRVFAGGALAELARADGNPNYLNVGVEHIVTGTTNDALSGVRPPSSTPSTSPPPPDAPTNNPYGPDGTGSLPTGGGGGSPAIRTVTYTDDNGTWVERYGSGDVFLGAEHRMAGSTRYFLPDETGSWQQVSASTYEAAGIGPEQTPGVTQGTGPAAPGATPPGGDYGTAPTAQEVFNRLAQAGWDSVWTDQARADVEARFTQPSDESFDFDRELNLAQGVGDDIVLAGSHDGTAPTAKASEARRLLASGMAMVLQGSQTGPGVSAQGLEAAEQRRQEGLALIDRAVTMARSDPAVSEVLGNVSGRYYAQGGINAIHNIHATNDAMNHWTVGVGEGLYAAQGMVGGFNALAGPSRISGADAGTALLLRSLAMSDAPIADIVRRVDVASSATFGDVANATGLPMPAGVDANRRLWDSPASAAGGADAVFATDVGFRLRIARVENGPRPETDGVVRPNPLSPDEPLVVYTNTQLDWKHAGADVRRLPDGTYSATGGHHLLEPNIQIKPGTTPVENANGTVTAYVQMRNPVTGEWIDKSNTEGGITTLFPSSWNHQRIDLEVNAAFANRTPVDNIGTSPSGIQIQFRFDNKLKIWRFSPLP